MFCDSCQTKEKCHLWDPNEIPIRPPVFNGVDIEVIWEKTEVCNILRQIDFPSFWYWRNCYDLTSKFNIHKKLKKKHTIKYKIEKKGVNSLILMIKKQDRQGQVKTRQDGINLSSLRLVLERKIEIIVQLMHLFRGVYLAHQK